MSQNMGRQMNERQVYWDHIFRNNFGKSEKFKCFSTGRVAAHRIAVLWHQSDATELLDKPQNFTMP